MKTLLLMLSVLTANCGFASIEIQLNEQETLALSTRDSSVRGLPFVSRVDVFANKVGAALGVDTVRMIEEGLTCKTEYNGFLWGRLSGNYHIQCAVDVFLIQDQKFINAIGDSMGHGYICTYGGVYSGESNSRSDDGILKKACENLETGKGNYKKNSSYCELNQYFQKLDGFKSVLFKEATLKCDGGAINHITIRGAN